MTIIECMRFEWKITKVPHSKRTNESYLTPPRPNVWSESVRGDLYYYVFDSMLLTRSSPTSHSCLMTIFRSNQND